MVWRISNAFCKTEYEREILYQYGQCCEVSMIMAVFSVNDELDETFFIKYECYICGQVLYPTSEISDRPQQWI